MDIKEYFKLITGLDAIRVCQIGISVWMIDASDGNTYKIG